MSGAVLLRKGKKPISNLFLFYFFFIAQIHKDRANVKKIVFLLY